MGVVFTSFAYLGSQAWQILNSPETNSPEDLVARQVLIPFTTAGAVSGVMCLCFWAFEMIGCVSVVEGLLFGSSVAPFIWQYLMHPAWHIFGCLALWVTFQLLVVMWGSRLGWNRPCVIWMGVPLVIYGE